MYKIYNSLLRTIDGINEKLENFKKNSDKYYEEKLNEIEVLIDGISKEKVCSNIIVYRYTKKTLFKALYKNNNKIAIERGFMSTSLLPVSSSIHKLIKDYNYDCLLRIYVPKGTPGIPIIFNNNQTRLKEYEFFFTKYQNESIEQKI